MPKTNPDGALLFKLFCNICRREIIDGMPYYKHPKHGFVCEYCQPFDDGEIRRVS